jgi:hypothetical protein
VHSLALRSDSTIVAWGDNGHGECYVPSSNAGYVAIAAGSAHSLGLKGDGSIVAWGYNDYGACDVPAPNAGFVAAAAGGHHSLGLKAALVGWGACCSSEGTCTYTVQESCPTPEVWQGGGTICFPNPCPPGGACCESSGLCTFVSADHCPATIIWQGAGTTCDPENPCHSGACCLRTEDWRCEIHPPTQCASYQGLYQGGGTLCEPNPCPALAGVDGGNPEVTRLQVLTSPNPSAGGAVIRCLLPDRAPTTVVLFDAPGRVVRHLHDGELPAGETPFLWDGRDDAGRDVPAGVYLVKVTTPGGETIGRIVLTR